MICGDVCMDDEVWSCVSCCVRNIYTHHPACANAHTIGACLASLHHSYVVGGLCIGGRDRRVVQVGRDDGTRCKPGTPPRVPVCWLLCLQQPGHCQEASRHRATHPSAGCHEQGCQVGHLHGCHGLQYMWDENANAVGVQSRVFCACRLNLGRGSQDPRD